MPCLEARMSSKGQVTLPAEVRRRLNLREGDRVDFYVDPLTGAVTLVARNRTLADLQGLTDLAPSKLPTKTEIREAVGRHLVDEDRRIGAEWNELREFERRRRAKAASAAE